MDTTFDEHRRAAARLCRRRTLAALMAIGLLSMFIGAIAPNDSSGAITTVQSTIRPEAISWPAVPTGTSICKNKVWPPRAFITVEPCAIAHCESA